MKDIRKYWDEMARFGPDRSVIEPNDIKGNKIKYITSLRDRAILDEIGNIPKSSILLDLGCGSGNLSRTLSDNGYNVIGVDISFKILEYTRRHRFPQKNLFIQYDGKSLPFPSDCFDACVTYEVLQHLADPDSFRRILEEIFRALKPGGLIVTIEQTRRRSRHLRGERKVQRSEQEILQMLATSGFHNKESRIIRRGHFPLIYLIRYGLIPSSCFPLIGRLEALFGRVFKRPCFDYANMIFVAEKPKIQGFMSNGNSNLPQDKQHILPSFRFKAKEMSVEFYFKSGQGMH